MAVNKTEKIPVISDDAAVKVAQKLLAEIQAKFERATNYPVVDDTTERARSILDNKPPKPKREVDEINVLREAVTLAASRLQKAQQISAEKIIKGIEPDYKKVRESLLEQAILFKISLETHDTYVQSLWTAGLSTFLPASWSLKTPIVGAFPGGRLDELISNLKIEEK